MKRAFLLLSLIPIILLVNACVDSTDGCIDPFASNYDLSADRECDDDCCTYPTFTLSTQYLYGEENVDSSIYYNVSADSYFKLRSFYLTLSDFELTGDAGNYTLITDVEDDEISDDLIGIKFRTSSNSPGSIAIEDSIRSIDFKIGIPDELDNPGDPNLDYSVIELLQDSSYFDLGENSFYKLIIGVEIDSISNEEVLLFTDDIDFSFTANVSEGTTRGNALSLQLLIDFERLFDGVQFQNENVVEASELILSQNIGTSIEVN